MPICFVGQPFKSPFQARYEDVIKVALADAELDPYKVDLDPSVDRIIDTIEDTIRKAALCLFDITEDNPNVWYELGFACALNKPIIMICCVSERGDEPFPFDIRHRKVLSYRNESTRDFAELRNSITQRARALLEKEQEIATMADSPIPEVAGVPPLAHAIVAVVLGECLVPGDVATPWAIANEMERLGYNKQGVSLGLRMAEKLDLIKRELTMNDNGDEFPAITITDKGNNWALANLSLFKTEEKPGLSRHRSGRRG